MLEPLEEFRIDKLEQRIEELEARIATLEAAIERAIGEPNV